MSRPKLLFVATEDSYFWSHRLPLARAARDAGCEVVVAARVRAHGERIRAEGFGLAPLELSRRGLNPWREARSLVELARLYRRLEPDLIHHVALKPVVYGSLAARAAGAPALVNAVMGTGFVFNSARFAARALRGPLRLALRLLLSGGRRKVIVQNPDDLRLMERGLGLDPSLLSLIAGSGVNLSDFPLLPEPAGAVRFALVSRLLWPKGVGEFVEAARLLRAEGVPARFALVGSPDSGNPESVPEERLRAWDEEGVVEWRGPREDIARVWAESHVAVLPSYYGEGVPKALLEAAACGRPIVTADAPGCREAVEDGENGILVPPRDPAALAGSLRRLAEDGELRRRMGLASRRRAETLFSEERVIRETLGLYRELLGARWPGGGA